MKKILILLIIMVSCSKEINNSNFQKNSEIPEHKINEQKSRLVLDNNIEFQRILHNNDLNAVLNYYKNEDNFNSIKDYNQLIFTKGLLIGKLTYNKDYIGNNPKVSEYLLNEMFDKKIPCQICIHNIVSFTEKSNINILNTNIPKILKENKNLLIEFSEGLSTYRNNDHKINESNEHLTVNNFEKVIYKYID